MPHKKYLVSKRNVLNEIIAREFTLQELRLFSIYLGRINPKDITTRHVRIDLNWFYHIMDLQPVRAEYLEKVTTNLLTKVVRVPTKTGGFMKFQLFKKCRVDKDENDKWYFEIDAHDDALELMFNYKRDYFKYELWNVLNLDSINQFRMYELLKQEEWRGERIISVIELKMLLGHEDNEYQDYRDFKRRVLNGCQKAIKAKTDISFTYEPHTRGGLGGKIQSLRFVITKNQDYKCQLNLDELLGTSITEMKQEVEQDAEQAMPDVTALSFISELSDKVKAQLLEITDGNIVPIRYIYTMAQQGNIRNLAGYMIYMVGEYMAGRVDTPVEVKRGPQKGRFVNFNQRDIDFAELERLELEDLKKFMGEMGEAEEYQPALGAL